MKLTRRNPATVLSRLYGLCVTVVLAVSCSPLLALDAEEVLVVANKTSDDSRALAEHYAAVRGIPAENVLLLETTRNYLVARKDFDAQIRRPIARYLVESRLAGRVRCLCLMWGIPVRVGPAAPEGKVAEVMQFYRSIYTKTQYRLASDYEMLGTVGRKFPAPQTEGLAPVGKLFEGPVRMPPPPLPSWKKLRGDINQLFKIKSKEAAELRDPRQRRIAQRQLMALKLDVAGLNGLLGYIDSAHPDSAPDKTDLLRRRKQAQADLKALCQAKGTKENVRSRMGLLELIDGVYKVAEDSQKMLQQLKQSDAAVDSELALLWWSNYPLVRHMTNFLNWRVRDELAGKKIPPTLMTARIDGPTPAEARRIIDDSVAAERKGLDGTFYIDAGGKIPAYDAHLTALDKLLREKTSMKVVLDKDRTLFAAGDCPDAALYVGWYSLRKYVPAFQWNPGAVGWHIASFEAMHLRDPDSDEWCVKMLQNGVAGTVGPVDEPYLTAFPPPDEFFPLLLTGKYTLAECYWRTTPTTSWRLTLIGDPLYRPFAANPQLAVEDLPSGLAPTPD